MVSLQLNWWPQFPMQHLGQRQKLFLQNIVCTVILAWTVTPMNGLIFVFQRRIVHFILWRINDKDHASIDMIYQVLLLGRSKLLDMIRPQLLRSTGCTLFMIMSFSLKWLGMLVLWVEVMWALFYMQ